MMNISEAISILKERMTSYSGLWAVAGGWAIDLSLGEQTREHEDLEIVVFRNDYTKLYRQFSNLHPNLIVSGDPPQFLPWDGSEVHEDIIQIRLDPVKFQDQNAEKVITRNCTFI